MVAETDKAPGLHQLSSLLVKSSVLRFAFSGEDCKFAGVTNSHTRAGVWRPALVHRLKILLELLCTADLGFPCREPSRRLPFEQESPDPAATACRLSFGRVFQNKFRTYTGGLRAVLRCEAKLNERSRVERGTEMKTRLLGAAAGLGPCSGSPYPTNNAITQYLRVLARYYKFSWSPSLTF